MGVRIGLTFFYHFHLLCSTFDNQAEWSGQQSVAHGARKKKYFVAITEKMTLS